MRPSTCWSSQKCTRHASLAVDRRRSTARSVSRSTTGQVSSLCAFTESPLTVTTPWWRTTHSETPSTRSSQSSPSLASRPATT